MDTRHRLSMASSSNQPAGSKQRAIIVGGGPAGALMALYLSQDRGFKVDLFEAFDENKIAGPTVRSWNVVLFDRGSDALKAGGVDLQKEAGERLVTLAGSLRHHKKEKTSKFFLDSSSICRGDFAKALLNKASKVPNVNVHFGCTFSKVDMEQRVATFERGNGDVVESEYDMLIGADGVNSRVRKELEENVPDFTVRHREDPMAFKTILIPIMNMEGADEGWKKRFHVTNSDIGCIIAPPRSDGMLTATVVLPSEGKTSFDALMKTTQDVRDFFVHYYPSAFGHEGPSEEVAKEFLERRTQQLRSTYCSRLAHGSIFLIGDAAHSMWASLGQGVNAALEDCQVFAQVLDSATEGKAVGQAVDVPKVLEAYNERRFEDAVAVCELSEEGMGGARSMRPAFAAQLLMTVLLNKTLGLLAPKVFTPPSLMAISGNKMSYGEILRGVKREATVTKAFFVAGVVCAVAGVARKVVMRV
ncbi:unnamed protein product [Ectocarpus sp. 6 AP-2014]